MKSVTVRYLGLSSSGPRKRVEVVSLDDSATLKDLLDFLTLKYGASTRNLFYDESGEFKPLVMFLVNGRATDDLGYMLKEGDEVSIAPLIAGG
jgi:MoaD family protein